MRLRRSVWRTSLLRPELGAAAGVLAVFTFFAVTTEQFARPGGVANFLDPAATLGIMAVVVAMLLIGGEFDLSAGVMTASGGLVVAMLTTELGWHIGAAVAAAVGLGLVVGLVNGLLVLYSGLPSFIVTLGTFLMLQGLNLGVTKVVTGTVRVRGLREVAGYEQAYQVFAKTVTLGGGQYRVTILWWLAVTALATWILLRTRPGNWIFAVGGSASAARAMGVPVARTKVALFMAVSVTAALVGTALAVRLASVQASDGIGEELQYIVAAVIGGCLLTGGYGSAVGAALGALIFGMAKQGIVFAGWDNNWFMLFLGALLLAATVLNHLVRQRAEAVRV